MDTKLKNISAPTLSSGNYGRGVQEQFSNIDKNFKILGNYDFVKGENGAGYNFDLVTLTSDLPGEEPNIEWSDSWVNYKIKTTILTKINNESDEEKLKCLSTLEGQQVMVYYLSNETPQYVGIQPFPFYDGRLLKLQTLEENESFTDCSGVVCTDLENDEVVFKLFAGFPTIYYDQSVGSFCWLIGGQESGLPAQGPRGAEGPNGYSLIVKCDNTEYDHSTYPNKYKITNIYITNLEAAGSEGLVPVGDDTEAQKILNELDAESSDRTAVAFVLVPETNQVYISPILTIYEGDTVIGLVTKTNTTKVELAVSYSNIESWFADLDKNGDNNYHKGIFIPYVPTMESPNTGAHRLYSEPVKSTDTQRKRLVVEPTTSISNIGTPDSDAEVELRYQRMGMKSTMSSVRSVFNGLYINDCGISSSETKPEKRFTYAWKSTPKIGTYEEPEDVENRPPFENFNDNTRPFQAYMCPDGFLWYKDPYTYLRVELDNGKVMVVGPNNNDPATGQKIISPTGTQENPISIAAVQSTASASLQADSYWSIVKTS